ncbi:MAG TPA: class I SAM-dependent methyltransferase [Mycobacterium sp.]|nr:class I SAM-dependent methyltransferase [Mycobacterium sp.]
MGQRNQCRGDRGYAGADPCRRDRQRRPTHPRPVRGVAGVHAPARKCPRAGLPVDLRHDWPRALCYKGFDTSQPPAWLSDGLLRFLPASHRRRRVSSFFASLKLNLA